LLLRRWFRVELPGAVKICETPRPRNQLGTSSGAKSFLRGAQIFQTMSNSFKTCPTHYCSGAKKILGGASRSLPPPRLRSWKHHTPRYYKTLSQVYSWPSVTLLCCGLFRQPWTENIYRTGLSFWEWFARLSKSQQLAVTLGFSLLKIWLCTFTCVIYSKWLHFLLAKTLPTA